MENLKQKALKNYLLIKLVEDLKKIMTNKDIILTEKELYDLSVMLKTIKGKIIINNK